MSITVWSQLIWLLAIALASFLVTWVFTDLFHYVTDSIYWCARGGDRGIADWVPELEQYGLGHVPEQSVALGAGRGDHCRPFAHRDVNAGQPFAGADVCISSEAGGTSPRGCSPVGGSRVRHGRGPVALGSAGPHHLAGFVVLALDAELVRDHPERDHRAWGERGRDCGTPPGLP